MLCPFCQTENRDDRETCYHCDKDLSTLRLVVNKAKHHYNQALEFAERDHLDDAIAELKNALELDGSRANVHVVLGTLYARQENFEKARECWRTALALDHNIAKAHDYLDKAEKGEYVFPAIRRLKNLALGVGATALVLLIAVVWMALPDAGLRTVRDSLDALAQSSAHSGRVRDDLAGMIETRTGSGAAREMARDLNEWIERDWRRRMTLGGRALDRSQPFLAHEVLADLLAESPDDDIQEAASRAQASAAERIRARIHESAEGYEAGRETFKNFERVVADASLRIGPFAVDDELTSLVARVRRGHHDRVISEAAVTIEGAEMATAVARAVDWKTENPDLAGAIDDLLDRRLTREVEAVGAAVDELIERHALQEANAQVRELASLFEQAHRPAPAETLGALDDRIEAAARRERYDAAHEAWRAQRWEEVLERTERPEQLTRDSVELAQIEAWRAQAREGWADAQRAWFAKLDPLFNDLRVSSEDAARAIEIWERTIEWLPRHKKWAAGPITFYAATAYLRLDRPARARELLDHIPEAYPKSYIVTPAKKFRARFAKALGVTDAPTTSTVGDNDRATTPPGP